MKVSNNRRLDQHYGLTITRCMALILSAFAMIGSIGLIGFGIQILVEISYTATIIGTNSISICPYIIILIGVLTFGLTPVGFYSIVIGDSKLMVLNMFGTFFIAGICVVTSTLGYNLNTYINDGSLDLWMTSSVKEGFGNPQASYVAEAWDRAHQQFRCCGKSGLKDWIESKWYLTQRKYPRQRFPESCCASCETMHGRFCTAFFVSPQENDPQLAKNQTICLHASNKCESADSSIANRNICLSSEIDFKYSADAFRHTNGCLIPLKNNLDSVSNRIFVYSFIFFIILFVSTVTWFVIHEVSAPILPDRMLNYR